MFDSLSTTQKLEELVQFGCTRTWVDAYYMLVDMGEIPEREHTLRYCQVKDGKRIR